MIVLTAGVEGTMPDGDVRGISVTAGRYTPDEVLSAMIGMTKQALTEEFPGIQDVQQAGEWREIEVPDPEDDELLSEEIRKRAHP